MLMFLTRRVLASLLVLLVASYLVYVLAASSGDPLADLRESNSPNKANLIAQRTALLHLDVPPPVRYFVWLGGVLGGVVGRFSLGSSVNGQPVTAELASAIGVTLQLVLFASLLATVVGITVGITTALRQYSAFDYSATFLSFLCFSLPIFWIAVMLKQFLAIGFNNFLADPVVGPVGTVIAALVVGFVGAGVVGGARRTRLIVFAVGVVVTAAVLVYISATRWLENPSLGIVVVGVLSLATAWIVTTLTAGWENRRARWTTLTVAVAFVVLYYPLTAEGWGLFNQFRYISFGTIALLALVLVAAGGAVGFAFGGFDRAQSLRAGAITAFVCFLIVLVDRYLHSWNLYVNDVATGRPIATIGSQTPDLTGVSYWLQGLDTFTHLVLPTSALILASIASYSRYTRASLLDVLNQDYIRTARAKGLSERTVIMRHAFRNALIPITTILALDFGALIGGAVLTETVFGWTGMGALFQQALIGVDLNPIMGVFLVTSIAAVLFNLIADLLYAGLDPRIRVAA
ncbi:ABC transporter permease [Amnibacterium kyonggiense]